MAKTIQHVQAIVGRALDGVTAWAESATHGADPAEVAGKGATMFEQLAAELRASANAGDEEKGTPSKGPRPYNDGLDMSEAAKRRAAGKPVVNTWMVAKDNKPVPPSKDFWPQDLSLEVQKKKAAKKAAGKGR